MGKEGLFGLSFSVPSNTSTN